RTHADTLSLHAALPISASCQPRAPANRSSAREGPSRLVGDVRCNLPPPRRRSLLCNSVRMNSRSILFLSLPLSHACCSPCYRRRSEEHTSELQSRFDLV